MGKIQRLGRGWIEEMIAFDRLCFPRDYWKREEWQELVEDSRSIYWAILEDGMIIANVFIYNWKGLRDYVKILNLSVHPKFRKRGLGQKLLAYVSEEMKNQGMYRFAGETRISNKAMQRVFENCGYWIHNIAEDYYDKPDEDAYKYILEVKDTIDADLDRK